MDKIKKRVIGIFIRYIILLLIAIPHMKIFYYIFSPLTVYPSFFLFKLFYDASLYSNLILINSCSVIEIIPSCVIGSAYYLLLILNLGVSEIRIKKRIIMIFSSFFILLFVNILRIFILGVLYTSNSPLSDSLHKLFWMFLSIVFVVGIWFAEVRFFKIKEIPFYDDLRFVSSHIKFKKSKRK